MGVVALCPFISADAAHGEMAVHSPGPLQLPWKSLELRPEEPMAML